MLNLAAGRFIVRGGMTEQDDRKGLVRHHLRIGWWGLLFFLLLGSVLEALHGFKIGWYLNVSSETRRLMFTLSHAHGTLFSLVHVAFAATLFLRERPIDGRCRLAGSCLTGGLILLPGGFFLGGLYIYSGDPGQGVLLAPLGALLMFIGVFATATGLGRETPKSEK